MKRLIAIAISGMLFCGAAEAQVYGTPAVTTGANSFIGQQTITLSTAPLQICFDATHCVPFSVSSSGNLTIAPVGTITVITGSLTSTGDIQRTGVGAAQAGSIFLTNDVPHIAQIVLRGSATGCNGMGSGDCAEFDTTGAGGSVYGTVSGSGGPACLMTRSACGVSLSTVNAVSFNATTYANCTALTTTGNVVGCTASDKRVKNDLGVISPSQALAKVLALPDLHQFTYKKGYGPAGKHYGWFAQDMRKAEPQIVSVGPKTALTPDGELQMDKNEVAPEALAAIKDQQAQISNLEKRLSRLEENRK